MTVVNTVLGPVKSSELGLTLCHEHVISSSPDIRLSFPQVIDRKATMEKAIRDLTIAKSEGLQTIMDPTTHDQGRDIERFFNLEISSAVSLTVSPLISITATSAPASASAKAKPLPIPWPAPVTTATCPSILKLSIIPNFNQPISIKFDRRI